MNIFPPEKEIVPDLNEETGKDRSDVLLDEDEEKDRDEELLQ